MTPIGSGGAVLTSMVYHITQSSIGVIVSLNILLKACQTENVRSFES